MYKVYWNGEEYAIAHRLFPTPFPPIFIGSRRACLEKLKELGN